MYRRYFACILLGSTPWFASIACAEDYKVDAPRVAEHELTPETDFTYSTDKNKDKNAYFGQIYGINYGVNHMWETSFFAEIEKQPRDTTRVSNFKWENIVAPFAPGENWVDIGFFVGIDKAVDNELTNNLEGKLLLEKDIGHFTHVANIILSHNFGPHAVRGEDSGFAWMTNYDVDEHFRPGIEYYTDISRIDKVPEFNRQSHVIGPVAQGEWKAVSYDVGALFGLTDGAPNFTIKCDLDFDF